MAISTPTLLDASTEAGVTNTITSASVSPSADSLILLLIAAHKNGGGSSIGINAITANFNTVSAFAHIATRADGQTHVYAYWAIATSSPSSGTVTVDFDTNSKGAAIHLVEIASGFDSSTPIAQFQTSINGGSNNASVTLGSSPASDSVTIGAINVGEASSSPTIEAGSQFTELAEDWVDDVSLQSQYDETSPSTNVDWTGIPAGLQQVPALAFEVAASSTGQTETFLLATADLSAFLTNSLIIPLVGTSTLSGNINLSSPLENVAFSSVPNDNINYGLSFIVANPSFNDNPFNYKTGFLNGVLVSSGEIGTSMPLVSASFGSNPSVPNETIQPILAQLNAAGIDFNEIVTIVLSSSNITGTDIHSIILPLISTANLSANDVNYLISVILATASFVAKDLNIAHTVDLATSTFTAYDLIEASDNQTEEFILAVSTLIVNDLIPNLTVDKVTLSLNGNNLLPVVSLLKGNSSLVGALPNVDTELLKGILTPNGNITSVVAIEPISINLNGFNTHSKNTLTSVNISAQSKIVNILSELEAVIVAVSDVGIDVTTNIQPASITNEINELIPVLELLKTSINSTAFNLIQVGLVITKPNDRTYLVLPEDRVLTIPTENRVFIAIPENRNEQQ